MAERAPVTDTQRVALLARPGKAADNLADALRQTGAELVLVADPNGLDEAGLLASQPHAVLVALEPGVEQAIDRLDSVLSSPELTVIFDEADLAAHRAGWDAARWARHLSAKLHRHQQVLPPGGEAETEEWYPSPGQLPKTDSGFAELDFGAFAEEAAVRADAVPVDGIQFDAIAKEPAPNSESLPVSEAAFTIPLAKDAEVLEVEALDTAAFDAGHVASDGDASQIDKPTPDVETMSEWVLGEAMQLEAEIPRGEEDPRTLDAASLQPMRFDEDAFFLETLSAGTTHNAAVEAPSEIDFDLPLDDDSGERALSATMELSSEMPSDLEFELATDFDDAPESPPQLAADFDFELSDMAADEGALELSAYEQVAPAMSDAMPAGLATGAFGELSLAGDDAAPTPAPVQEQSAEASRDLSSLEARISHLSLVDIENVSALPTPESIEIMSFVDAKVDASPEPALAAPPPLPTEAAGAAATTGIGFRGIVLIEAGLGGPDPVRQVLSALPPTFPLPVLVRLHLQGGRYDRLVTQMERASSLPVALATVGEYVRSGCIYFLPEGVGLRALSNGMEFIAHPSPARTIFAALPAEDSAVVFLSGSDSALIEDAMQAAEAGALVVAQSPEDCYDGAACAHLRSQGTASGVPSELARRLLTHWTS